MATLGAGYSFSVNEQVTAAKLATLVTGGTCSSIVNADIDGSAAIANSKLNLASVSQAVAMSGGLTLSSNGLTMTSVPINAAKGSDVSSATTPNITSTTGNLIHITGTTTITGFATGTAGIERTLVFDGALTFTHNATSLILPGGANITTAANDVAFMRSEGSGNWRCVGYIKADGTPVVAASFASQAQMEAASSNTVAVTPGRQHYHPSMPKAWCMFNGATTGTNAPTVGTGVTSITRNGTGDWTVNLATAFSSTNYGAIATVQAAAADSAIGIKVGTALSASAARFSCTTVNNSADDSPIVTIVFYGDWA